MNVFQAMSDIDVLQTTGLLWGMVCVGFLIGRLQNEARLARLKAEEAMELYHEFKARYDVAAGNLKRMAYGLGVDIGELASTPETTSGTESEPEPQPKREPLPEARVVLRNR